MALKNIVQVYTPTIGNGALTLGGAVQGYKTFIQAGCVNGETYTYGIHDFDAAGNLIASEVGRGTYNAIFNTFARTTVLASTNADVALVLSGNARVFITGIAEDFISDAPSDGKYYARRNGTWADAVNVVPVSITVTDESADTLCYLGFFTDATGNLGPKTNTGLTFDASKKALGVNTVPVSGQQLTIVPDVATTIGIAIKGVALQSANLLELQNVGGATLSAIEGRGTFIASLGSHASNFFMGHNAGNSTNTGQQNFGLGSQALQNLAGGNYNYILGNLAGVGITSGSYNTAVGYTALSSLTTNGGNTAIGYASSASLTGFGNVTVGLQSGTGLGAADGNTYIGYAAAYKATTGSYNIAIGFLAGINLSTESNILIIDNQGRASASDEISKAIIYGVMAVNPGSQTLRINAVETIAADTVTTNAPLNVVDLNAWVRTASTGFAAGGGVSMTMTGETATDGTSQTMASLAAVWVDPTNATRKAKLQLSAFDTAARLGIEIEASGSAAKLGFFGGTTAVQQVLSAYTTNPQNSAYSGIDNAQAGTVYAQLTDLNALRVAYENLRLAYDDLRTKLQTSTIIA